LSRPIIALAEWLLSFTAMKRPIMLKNFATITLIALLWIAAAPSAHAMYSSTLGCFINRDPGVGLDSNGRPTVTLQTSGRSIQRDIKPYAGRGYQNGMSLYRGYFVPQGLDPSGRVFEERTVLTRDISTPIGAEGGVILGRTFANLQITWQCVPCCIKQANSGTPYSDSWKLTLSKFSVDVLMLIRTHFPDSDTEIPTAGNWQITQEKTREHEQKHANGFRKWHDTNEPKAKEDFNTGCKFYTQSGCEITAQMLVSKYQNDLEQERMFEAAHFGNEWGVNDPHYRH
jgi:hypothetical protein